MSSPAQRVAAELLALLTSSGVEHIFLAPGARSQALAVAASQLADADRVELHVRLDERSLGFNALGAALASGQPTALIVTSGTAVANLHPAVLEASHSGVPMILLTADRPHELRGVGANQTTNQVGIFVDAVRACFDLEAPTTDSPSLEEVRYVVASAIAAALGETGGQPGPVQINLAFREPLSGSEPNAGALFIEPLAVEPAPADFEFALLDGTVPTVVIAGAEAGPEATELAEAFGWPLLAEPSSGARFGENAILGYRLVINERRELADNIGRVIVFGKPTLSRQITKLFYREDVEVIVVRSKTMGHFNVGGRAQAFVNEVTVSSEPDGAWLESWRIADQQLRLASPVSGELTRRELVEQVWAATEGAENLLLGASRLIREAETWAPAKPVNVFANRGLAGIDGTIATATGIAIATGLQTRALMGDLTFLHDASSLAIDPLGPKLDIQLVVGNDGGGSIFESLEMRESLSDREFDRLFRTPQAVNIATLAIAYGWLHIPVANETQLAQALKQKGRVVIEVALS
jgi:2-succinyl-5-enolpyruvyl-6-hydroxy-3-cyclohexene-1-carboxylate synthase